MKVTPLDVPCLGGSVTRHLNGKEVEEANMRHVLA